MSKYIQQITTGIVFINTPHLEKMANMRPISDSEAKALLGGQDPVKVDVDPIEPVAPVEPVKAAEEPVENPEPKTFRELIEAATTKEEVEALVLEHTGADIDRRKSLATLKEEALA
jgi:hypothetical protein